jgi:hypothetical protein
MASIPDPAEPEAEQPAQLPDAVNAAPPAHLLRVLECRTGLEYLAALRAARRIADWPQMSAWKIVLLQPVNGVRKTFPVNPIDCLSIARVISAAT